MKVDRLDKCNRIKVNLIQEISGESTKIKLLSFGVYYDADVDKTVTSK